MAAAVAVVAVGDGARASSNYCGSSSGSSSSVTEAFLQYILVNGH
jgi:hypothetical protein